MKALLFSLILFLFYFDFSEPKPLPLNPFDEITVCHDFGPGMEQFSDDPEFIKLHPAPDRINYSAMGEMINFDTPDGKKASGYFIPASNPDSDKWLFVYQEWWGLNDQIKEQADIFYNDLNSKVNVLALDMYDGKVTSDPQEAGQFMRSANEARLQSIVLGAQQFAGSEAMIANVGWCFGGGWSLKSALLTGSQNIGSVMYYGMPVQDVEMLKTLNSDVLGLFATEEYISKEIIENFAQNMEKAGKDLEYKIFDAAHGFANPSNPRHDPEATSEAYEMAIGYLRDKFGE
ncbi:dienelactone hydrolase family protein [Algoriphagus sediminis]|uniref:Dienelactone hydrolase family protein n=1 Tax=Algoriphagus sediminis TaxID=3057113 RepID=A0ABT7YGT9_9BACT|nr:dienelactone hydrolase family protein [Algoriphagus sediminis]MDN3205741.1 dienelactone hydrolase family protein [Algoriphagus sediminis]